MGDEYKVVAESVTGHCCFDYSVVKVGDEDEAICECFEKEDADLIARALNKIAHEH